MLLDTNVLLWLGNRPDRLPDDLLKEIEAHPAPAYSVISIWEIGIKAARKRRDFGHDPRTILEWLSERRWQELPFTSAHAIAAAALPEFHCDPFDRALVGQAQIEGLTLVTSDAALQRYPASIRLI